MGDILIRNLDDAIMARLSDLARAADKSVEQMAREILAAAAKPSRTAQLARMDAIRAMSPPNDVDSTALIRAERDRR